MAFSVLTNLGWIPLVIAVFFLTTALEGRANQPNGRFGDAYISASISDARTLVPFLADDSTSSEICGLIFNGLTKVDRNLNIVGDLAESWEISSDNLRILFHLRKDAFWHDGTKVTARDVKFTYHALLNPQNGCPYIDSYSDIEEINVSDDYTIEFRYKRPYAPALLKLGMGILPEHILGGTDIRNSAFKRNPRGSGPYIFKKWETDQHIIMDANRDYFEHRPFIQKYVMRVIPDQAVQFLELLSGSIDSMGLVPYQYRYRTDTPKFKTQFEKYKYLSHSYTYIGYNLESDLFKDKRVRQALAYAVDKSEIINGVLMGLGEPTTGPFLKGTYSYNESVPDYPYDPERAKALLEEAGWADHDGDGILDKGGRPFKFRLITNQGNKVREDIAAIVQRRWRDIGIQLEVQTIAWAAFLNEFIDKKNFEAVILGWTLPIDPDCYSVWHSEAAGEGGLNFISYRNPEVDRLITEGRSTFESARRAAIYKKIHAILAEDEPYLFLFIPYATPAISKRFRGIDPAPAGIGYNFIDWFVTADEWRYHF